MNEKTTHNKYSGQYGLTDRMIGLTQGLANTGKTKCLTGASLYSPIEHTGESPNHPTINSKSEYTRDANQQEIPNVHVN